MDTCDFCNSDKLEIVYEPKDTTRGLKVHVCNTCGLVQSLPRIDHVKNRPMAVSAGANWGNVRYGKAFRTSDNIKLLREHIDLDSVEKVLDVGANRGAFCKAFKKLAPKTEFIALEPDTRVIDDYKDLEGIELVTKRVEETNYDDETFDLIYSCHTQEHLASPQTVLCDHFRTLKTGGYLFLELPNIAIIETSDIVEEWFIDKHLYHYSAGVCVDQLRSIGFEILVTPAPEDLTNLTVIARKPESMRTAEKPVRPDRALKSKQMLTAYQNNRFQNISALKKAAQALEEISDTRIVVWGGGRLLHSLIEIGGLDPNCLAGVVDKFLPEFTEEVHNVRLSKPEDLKSMSPDLVVIMSRVFYDEIRMEIDAMDINVDTISFADLLTRARESLAA